MSSTSLRTDKLRVFLAELRSALPADVVLWRPRDLEVYGYDGALTTALPDAVVVPTTTAEVAAAVTIAGSHGVPVTPRGGGTSLSGGPVPACGGLLVSLTRMNRILEISRDDLCAVVQPGVVNADLVAEAARQGLLYAPDPASQIACTLGGNVGENAGGPHCLKYGVTANHILGLTAVAADGAVVSFGARSPLAAGLDLRGLVVGGEGTLAVVTEITCRLLPAPPAIIAVLACFGDIDAAADAVSDIIAAGVLPATLEMADRTTIEAIEMYDHLGYPRDVEALLVMEIDGLSAALPPQVRQVEEVCRARGALRFERAENQADRDRLWRGRKGATAALSFLAPAKLSTDVNVPRSRLAEALAEVRDISRRHGLTIGNVFHAGDGNLHPQILFDPRDPDQVRRANAADEEVTRMALRFGGVISGEHGIGSDKRKFMPLAYTADELRAMAWVKEAFDPAGLLNPGKILPDDAAAEPEEEAAPRRRPPAPPGSGSISAVAAPTSVEELARLVADCYRSGCRLNVPAHSLVTARDALSLDLSRLSGLLAYDPGNLTVTVAAGTTLSELLSALAEKGQTVGAWRRVAPEVTAGALAMTAWPTPGLARYGAARDTVLGMTVVVQGKVLRLGSTCVKNSSGYALQRLFAGSFGCLGVATDVTVRTHPIPEAEARLAFLAPERLGLAIFLRDLLGASLPAEYACVRPSVDGRWFVDVNVVGFREEVGQAASLVQTWAADGGLEALAPEDSGPGPVHPCPDHLSPAAQTPESGQTPATQAPTHTPRWYAYPLSAALDVALAAPEGLCEYWPLSGLVSLAGTQPEGSGPVSSQRLSGSADELLGDPSAPAAAVAHRLKRLFDPAGLLPPW